MYLGAQVLQAPLPYLRYAGPLYDLHRGLSKEEQRITDKLVKEMEVNAAEKTAFEALGPPWIASKLTIKNDPSLSCNALTRLFSRYAEWRVPKDHALTDGSTSGPIAEHLTNLRVAIMMRLIPGTCPTCVQYEQGLVVCVRAIDGSEIQARQRGGRLRRCSECLCRE